MFIIHFLSYLQYGPQLWGQANKESQNKTQVIQNWALRKISFKKLHDPTVQLYKDLKGNMQFVFLCNPPKSGTSEVCVIFTQITQKIPTKDKIYWLELITEILKLSTNIQCEKNNHPAYLIFQKICTKVNKKLIFLTYFGPLKENYR